jgi:hypothetical protein
MGRVTLAGESQCEGGLPAGGAFAELVLETGATTSATLSALRSFYPAFLANSPGSGGPRRTALPASRSPITHHRCRRSRRYQRSSGAP